MNSNSRTLRKNQTDALDSLVAASSQSAARWIQIPYVVDFVCIERRLIIELDGGQHASAMEVDQRRTEFLEHKGFQVVRFWNNEALGGLEAVLERILEMLNERH